jgi:hypothetical protein
MYLSIYVSISIVRTKQVREAHDGSQCEVHVSYTTPAGHTYLLHQVQGQDDRPTLPEVDPPLLLPQSCNKQHPVR